MPVAILTYADEQVNSINRAPEFRLSNATVHAWKGSGQTTLTNFVTDVKMSPLIGGLDAEATQQHTFSVSFPPDSAAAFTELPHVHANGTMTFALQQDFSGIVFLQIKITDDGNQPAVVYDGGDLGILDHAALKAGENRNFSFRTLELVVSDSLMQVQVNSSQYIQTTTLQLESYIAEALALSGKYVSWDASLDSFVVRYGRLQNLLQVCLCFFIR
jgi:hypothetical protein